MLSFFPLTLLSEKWRPRVIALIATVILGICGYSHWRAPDPVQQARLDGSISHIQELERQIVGDVAFMRVGDRRSTRIREHIEKLGESVQDLKRSILRDYPAVVTRSADLLSSLYGRVDSQERAVSSLMLHLEFMLERLYRIPETLSALERGAPGIWADQALTAAVGSLLRDLFVSAARADASQDVWFEDDLERLRQIRDGADPEMAAVIERLVDYCGALTERARFVDSGLRELEDLPVGKAVAELGKVCLEDFVGRHEQARVWRWILVLSLGVVVAALSFRVLVLRKSQDLDRAEVGLLKSQLRVRDESIEDLDVRLSDERLRAERAEASHRRSRLHEQAALKVQQDFLMFLGQHVRGPARALLSEVSDEATAIEDRPLVARNAQALNDTLSDLFDMQQVQAEDFQLERAECALGSLLERVEDYGRGLARKKAISLSLTRAPGLPTTVFVDEDRLRRALQSLLEHAILSTDRGEVELSVGTSSSSVSALQFVVRDSGRGMNSDRIDFLFTPPQDGERIEGRAESLATPGLALVPSLAKVMGGNFHVDSVVGSGTTISFDVEILEPRALAAPVGVSELLEPVDVKGASMSQLVNTKPLAETPLAGRRILVAEDGADNRRLMEFILLRAGADVEMAVNGEKAYEDAMAANESGQPYDLILMDMNMPVMDGYQATEALRADGYERAIVALTASALPENRERCLEVGCDEFMTKPVDAKVVAFELAKIALEHSGPCKPPMPKSDDVKKLSPVLSEYADDDDMGELIELFIRDLKSDIRRINVALTDGDLESLGVLAHQLKGSAGSYGFPQLTVQADRLESCVRTGVDPDMLEQEVRDFVELCKRISA